MPELEKKVWEEIVVWDLEQTASRERLQDEMSFFSRGPYGVENELGNEGPPHQRDTLEILFLAEMFHVPSISFF